MLSFRKGVVLLIALNGLWFFSNNCVALTSDAQFAARSERLRGSFAMLIASHSPAAGGSPTLPVSYDLSPAEETAALAMEDQLIEMGLLDDDKLTTSVSELAKVIYVQRQSPEDIEAEIDAWENGQPAPVLPAAVRADRIEEQIQMMDDFYANASTSIGPMDAASLSRLRLNLATAILSYDYLKEKLASQPEIPLELIEKNLEWLVKLRRDVIDEEYRRGL